jgi:hypothetical protein
MRVFAVEGSPIRILAEGVAGGPALEWDEEDCLAEEQLLATSEGRAALEAWRRGDDSVYEISESANLALAEAEDELIRAGSEARPDLHLSLRAAMSGSGYEIEHVLHELRKAGVEVLDPDGDAKSTPDS